MEWVPDVAPEADSGSAGDAAGPDATGPDATGPRLTVAAVARRLGVAPSTLRTWARRYGLGPGEHAAGAHRRYTPADLVRLHTMRRLTLEGVAPAEAARVALAADASVTSAVAVTPLTERSAQPDGPGRVRGRGGPGGRVLAMPGADATVRGLGRAAMALDSATVTATVRAELARWGVVPTWEQVLLPVLSAAGAYWAATGDGVEVEHLLSDCVVTVLREVSGRAPEQSGRPVLLACAPDEQHVLPLHAVAAGLAERGVGTRVLGAAMPAGALAASVRRTGPAALFVWSQLPGTADPDVLSGLPITRPPTSLVVGGPGWDGERLPSRVALARELTDALDLIGAAIGA